MNLRRVFAYTTRHLYLYKRSFPRLMEVFYWPLLDLLLWGFVTVYLARNAVPGFVAFFVGALILWDMLFRSQQGISVSFLEDVWSRNLLNIFVSPMTAVEYIASLLVISIVKLLLTSSVMITLAWLLYSYNIFHLGIMLVPLIANLIIMGWAIGIITTALILRFGQETEVLAWGVALFFQPISAVFYPVSVLPPPLDTIARFTPSSHVFEGMRAVMTDGAFPYDDLVWAVCLNAAYITVAVVFFSWNFRMVKKKGLLVKIGE
ncbi:MAG: ABC transporter [Deltaproteobacteria bacterium RIFCSPLOWO2_02_FULL_53_8]|nr:MAG: ABC transporter [Deltaproteobacteria bacterium RIFCSPLOWO2_02_FULL_53_8]